MAGGNNHPQFIAHSKYPDILVDPAVERWYHMKENTHVYFRMTPRTVRYSLILGLGIPALCYWAVMKGENKFKPTDCSKKGEFWKSS